MTQTNTAQEALARMATTVDQVARRTGELVPQAWDIAVQKQITEGWFNVSVFSFAAVFFIVAARTVLKRSSQTLRDHNTRITAKIMIWGVAFAFVLICMGVVYDGVTRILNPEYYAAAEVLYLLQ